MNRTHVTTHTNVPGTRPDEHSRVWKPQDSVTGANSSNISANVKRSSWLPHDVGYSWGRVVVQTSDGNNMPNEGSEWLSKSRVALRNWMNDNPY